MENDIQSEAWWSDAWLRHIEGYLAAPPRTGIWLSAMLNLKRQSVLECAGGSCRDSRYLASKGVHAVGSDFDQKTLDYLSQRFPGSNHIMLRQDAFDMDIESNSYDIVFSNGFFVLFDDNQKLHDLLREQVRVARKSIIILVHNKENRSLVARFAELSKKDSLYDIRFFNRKELSEICRDSKIEFNSLRILKFGGSVDRAYSLANRLPFLKSILYWMIPRLYRFQPWTKVERIALIIGL